MKASKPKRCKSCKEPFTPFRPRQVACSHGCAISLATAKREKEERKQAKDQRKEHREAKERIKSRADWLKEAQTAFNAWIRARDHNQPCISCQRYHDGQYHAGHYRTTKAAPELRFCEINVWKQCSVCNNHLSGNILEYRINLIKKGIDVDWLDGPHEPQKYTITELKAIKAEYKLKLKNVRIVDA